MNKKWEPDYIYIDAGNGATNAELLYSKAKKASSTGDKITARLLKTLKKYDSGSNITVKDVNNKCYNCYIKQYIYNH